LARLLRRFTVAPHTIKLSGGGTAKGYLAEDFADAFARFVQKPTFRNRNPVTTLTNIGPNEVLQPSPPENRLRLPNAIPPNKDGLGYGVTVANPPTPKKEAILL
jgi:hypothetical protein